MIQELALHLANRVRSVRDRLSAEALGRLVDLRQKREGLLGGSFDEEEWVEVCAQTCIWREFAADLARRGTIDRRGFEWIISQEGPLWKEILDVFSVLPDIGRLRGEGAGVEMTGGDCREAERRWEQLTAEGPPTAALADLFEAFLAACCARRRKRRGAFFTPPAAAGRLAELVDEALRRDFALPLGLADLATWDDRSGHASPPQSSGGVPPPAQSSGGVPPPTAGKLSDSASSGRPLNVGGSSDANGGVRGGGGVSPPLREDSGGGTPPLRDEPFLRILDPAAGCGVFLVAAIERIHSTLTAAWGSQGCSEEATGRRWNRYVPQHLLPRLFGLELSPAACLAAHLEIAQKLAETGYAFVDPPQVQVFTADTLASEDDGFTRRIPMTVILGNPPFAALTQNRSPWIERLLKGVAADGRPTASYFHVDGQPLGERKHWLHDDYVKFLRYAQWRIEQAGCGVVGLVTNHSYLDNPTFRGVRRALMQAFSRIDVIDLHGNRKKRETAPDGRRDENLFPIDQGVALSVLVRPPRFRLPGGTFFFESRSPQPSAPQDDEPFDSPARPPNAGKEEGPARQAGPTRVRRADLWGSREEKQRRLRDVDGQGLEFTPLAPSPPFYFFAPRDESLREEYHRGWRLTDIMPVYVAAPVTARDGLAVAFTREELIERLAEFRDLSIPDETIRQRYFPTARTNRYPPGDTRGWKLAEARRRLAACRDWQAAIRPCLYRPFDRRWIYWSELLIDWPRREVMRHLESPGNLALIARRQMPPTEPCRYFWATDQVVLDGVIRSDNRGGETVFPLFLREEQRTLFEEWSTRSASGRKMTQRVNFSREFLAAVTALVPQANDDSLPVRTLHYLYALFQAPSYRSRYAEHLRIDFPRVFLARRPELFAALSDLGAGLMTMHLLREGDGEDWPDPLAPGVVAPGFPKYDGGKVWINPQTPLAPAPGAAWEWRVGGHQVCRKWLKDRQGRVLTEVETAAYRRIVSAAQETQHLAQAIDRAIDRHGGWPEAFALRQEQR